MTARGAARASVAALTAVFGALTLAGFAGGLAWYCDLANHFRVQYALILGVPGSPPRCFAGSWWRERLSRSRS